ncbi:unnamed protein product [Ilex paraguariensis]|uniref:Pentatricopeptide repeat-containing protein n=1 Tax=Ilex paraguariensis TaxID=185542 RepID=A0ABC8SUH0_9AQUA
MKHLIAIGHLNSNSRNNILCSHVSKFQNFRLSMLSSASKLHNSKKTEESHMKNQRKTQNFDSLFNEIVEILGTENLIVDKDSSGFSISEKTHLRSGEKSREPPYCAQSVCENAQAMDAMELEKENSSCLGDIRSENLGETDVSPLVQKIAEIVRGENRGASIEELLGSASFEYNVDVVDKVLKRCFKVPHLALRFFNWVKLSDGFCHTTDTYNTMIYIASEAKEFRLVEGLVEEMEKSSCERNVKTWTILISHFGKAKLIGKALLVFEKMKKSGLEPDEAAYKLMLRALCDAGKAEIATEFYKEMVHKDMEIEMRLYKLLLKCLARFGDIEAVHLIVDDMIKVSQIPEHVVYACMLKSFCILGRIGEALELIRNLKHKSITLDPESFETLVKGLCRADRIADALEIVDIMNRRNVVDGKIYGIIIDGYLRRNDVSKAFETFQSIKESGRSPTVSTYTELIQHLFRLNEFQKASDLYNEMLEKGVEVDNVAVTAMVAGHIRQNCISQAWEEFKSMQKKGIKMTRKSYVIFIKELCKISRTDEILKVLNEMQASKILVGDDLFNWIKSYLERKGETKELEKVKQMQRSYKHYPQESEESGTALSSVPEPNLELKSNQVKQGSLHSYLLGSTSSSYSELDLQEICQILSSSKDWCLMQEKLEKCSISFTSELVVEILRKCSLHGGAALHFFSWVGKQAGYGHTKDTYNMAIKIAGRGKDFKHMRSLFFEMKRNGFLIASDTWTILIMQYGRVGLTEIALRTFREMKASGCTPTGSMYKYLIVSLCGRKGRKVDKAIQTFQEMIRAGCIPDKELVEIYLHCLCEDGKLVDARRCTEFLHKVGFSIPLAYSLYIRALCRVGSLEEALALVDEVGPEQPILDQYIYGSLVHGLLRMGRLEEALAKVESMKQVKIYPTVHVYTSLIVHFFKEKQMDKALEIYERMKEEGCEPTIVTCSALIRGYMSMGKVSDAWNVFHHLKQEGPLPDFKTYSMFITCLCKVGKSEEALQLISEMLDSGIFPSSVNFRTVFYGLNREGKHNSAQIVLQKKLHLASKRKFLT